MKEILISQFPHIKETFKSIQLSFKDFADQIKHGKYRLEIEKVKADKDLKAKILPYVTISGIFNQRNESGIKEHSGLICMDFDDIEKDRFQEIKETLRQDRYTYFLSDSASGTGLFLVVKISPDKHLKSFEYLSKYYFDLYNLQVDIKCKDVSRARFVSYDPECFLNEDSAKLATFLPKAKKIKEVNVYASSNDFERILKEIQSRSIDLTDSDYDKYLRIGFSIASGHGENGRQYFHTICQQSNKYSAANCDKQYTQCVRSKGHGVTINSFYHYCKEYGIKLQSKETLKVIEIAKHRASDSTQADPKASINKYITEQMGLNPFHYVNIIDHICQEKSSQGMTIFEKLEFWIDLNYKLKRNDITRVLENDGEALEEKHLNSMWIRACKEIDEKINYNVFERIIFSEFVEGYNPIKDFINDNKASRPNGNIENLARSIETENSDYAEKFIRHWLVGMIASIYGQNSPLVLVLQGEKQNTGKTQFFRRLLPKELMRYYAESKLDAGKDDLILMTQKILICDDEMGGKSKKENKFLKDITSKEWFNIREPYGRFNVDLRRLAVLCGTTNDDDILSDPTGNRRTLPIHVLGINHDLYNSINKTDLLIEAYHLYKDGFQWELNSEDINYLGENTEQFEKSEIEKELIIEFFRQPEQFEPREKMTATRIKCMLENETGLKNLNITKIGARLKELGFIKKGIKRNGIRHNIYEFVWARNINLDGKFNGFSDNDEDKPF